MCQERCGFSLCYINEYSGSGLSEDRCHPPSKLMSWSQAFLQGQPDSEKCILFAIEVKPICKSRSCGCLLSVLRHFDWCVYLNPRHLPHRPKEDGDYTIIRCLRSHCQGWQQSGCVFWMLACTYTGFTSFRVVASLRLANRLGWCYMWNMKSSGHCAKKSMEDKQAERMIHYHENYLPGTLWSCSLNQHCFYLVTSRHKDSF